MSPDERYATLSASLTQARKDSGLTQSELAGRLGRRQPYVSKYESRERRLDVVEYLDICRALGVDACNLLAGLEGTHE